jgi:hypothetical protein
MHRLFVPSRNGQLRLKDQLWTKTRGTDHAFFEMRPLSQI